MVHGHTAWTCQETELFRLSSALCPKVDPPDPVIPPWISRTEISFQFHPYGIANQIGTLYYPLQKFHPLYYERKPP